MKKTLLALLLVFGFNSTANASELSGSVIFASNYIYRGMSYNSQGTTYQSQGSPVIQGTLDYFHNGFGLTYFTGPADTFDTVNFVVEKDVESDWFSYYTKTIGNVNIGVGVNYYGLLKNNSNDTIEYNANVSYKALRLDESYSEVYSGADTNYSYTTLKFTPQLNSADSKASLNLVSKLGYVYFREPLQAGTSNYYDYQAGLSYSVDGWRTEIAYTNTLERSNPYTKTKTKITTDGTVTIVVSKTFSILGN